MVMKNPPHPGEIIREDIIKALGLTVNRAAEILDVRRATLSDVTNGKASVSAEVATLVALVAFVLPRQPR